MRPGTRTRAASASGVAWHDERAEAPASARIVSIDIAGTTSAFGGREFGTVGAYEVVRAIARYEVDPRLPLNAMLGCQVFDGVHIHISGASLNSQNQMFGRPGEKGDDAFPFTYATLFDPVSRRTDGWLARCQAEGNCPKVIHTDSENEVWTAGGLLYTDTQGRDIGFPANVRTYLFASTQHGPAGSLEQARAACEPVSHRCQRLPHSLRHDTRGKARRCAALRQGLDTRSPPGPRRGTSRHAQRERFPTGMT